MHGSILHADGCEPNVGPVTLFPTAAVDRLQRNDRWRAPFARSPCEPVPSMRIPLRRVVLSLVVILLVGAAGIAGFIAVGWYNISALSPHLPPVEWLLHTAMRESVQFHARGIEAPDLSDPALVTRAAGHFSTACAPCHGAPGVPPDAVGRGLLPDPPSLSETVPSWHPNQLYWITENGIKMTGMPAWAPTHRDDEVWAIVAFMLRLPEMSAAEYRQLANASLARDPDIVPTSATGADIVRHGASLQGLTACGRCHGLDGAGYFVGGVPRLSGQDPEYLAAALEDFATGARPSGIMGPVAEALTAGQRRATAEYYAAIVNAPAPPPPRVELETLRLGGALAAAGAADRGIPACRSCHGGAQRDGIPALAGQFAGYMHLRMHLWRTGARGAAADVDVMQRIARRLTDDEIRAVSLYYASLRDNTRELALGAQRHPPAE